MLPLPLKNTQRHPFSAYSFRLKFFIENVSATKKTIVSCNKCWNNACALYIDENIYPQLLLETVGCMLLYMSTPIDFYANTCIKYSI